VLSDPVSVGQLSHAIKINKVIFSYFFGLTPSSQLADILLVNISSGLKFPLGIFQSPPKSAEIALLAEQMFWCHARFCKRSETSFKSLLFWLAGELSWLAVKVLFPCQK